MKETKVYVDELPVNCDKCKYYTQFDNGKGCMITQELRPMDEKENYIQPDCPLVNIKIHDRELVKEVCERIRKDLSNKFIYFEGKKEYYKISDILELLDHIQKEKNEIKQHKQN